MQRSFHVTVSSIYPLGVCFMPEGLHISAVCARGTECGILLFDRKHKNGVRIPFLPEGRRGGICAMMLQGYQDRNCSYLFYCGDELFQDPYAKALVDERKYGEKKEIPARCKVYDSGYAWGNDRALTIPFEESLFYLLHVRGYTKHRSSGVQARGTYAGIIEKIPYLKELGITALLLMPAYEFNEVLEKEKQPFSMEQAISAYKDLPQEQEESPLRLNYWGYQEGLYFAPKYAYARSKDAVTEFKDMVRALHENGIEVMMQFYFPPTVDHMKILSVLKFWVLEYHIDGFQLMGVDLPMQMLCQDPLLAETKLLGEKNAAFSSYDGQMTGEVKKYRNYGVMNEAFLYDIRKLLKGDADMINSLIRLCRENAADKGIVNYIARQDGFRLCDLVSYDKKHNEANGEDNQDGSPYNYSWNCGIEGKTRKKNILSLRLRQMKNAMTYLLLSQGTPLIYGGDEFANSQEGNNNPYCQDNAVCWIKWNQGGIGAELLEYTRALIRFRKEHAIFHMEMPLRGTDYLSCGYPDISFHGKDAWRPDTGMDSRSIGILCCGRYAKWTDAPEDALFYIGINMHWEPYVFGLPQMPKGKEWVRLFSTNTQEWEQLEHDTADGACSIKVLPRTIVVYATGNLAGDMAVEKKKKRGKNFRKTAQTASQEKG
ncbi:MAG: alpha-amylase family glycosyl hydrolase [Roseburia sp.]|nr:alpha-amylase family glycosyl hydrolase [Ruminococcus sp.]MCM1154607.1 alpha-amylase family glycosyl hydrolase [Roseburia sp.]MCM1241692.1 alpha-amylase family glycosyl hydrolase [Roseburia sp.]